jgi:arylsulfatase A-like enzyme
VAYTHNPIADTLLRQFMTGMEEYIPMQAYFLNSNTVIDKFFQGDRDIATLGWNRSFNRLEDKGSYSLFFSKIVEKYQRITVEDELRALQTLFPRGVPHYDNVSYFTLEEGIDGILNLMREDPQPFLGYYHFLPPHNPFKTRTEFVDIFAGDGYKPLEKPTHLFKRDSPDEELAKKRRLYDEYILYVDAEFARLYAEMAQNGLLDNTWLVLTSDHGELFERGILGHITPTLYQPVIHIPLVVFPPGQSTRVDVHNPTSAIDLLPTLMQVTGQDIPDWAEGEVLPPFSASPLNSGRDIFAMKVSELDQKGGFSKASATIIHNDHKLIWYFGYEIIGDTREMFELYDLSQDPEEQHNLYPERADIANQLLPRLQSKFE